MRTGQSINYYPLKRSGEGLNGRWTMAGDWRWNVGVNRAMWGRPVDQSMYDAAAQQAARPSDLGLVGPSAYQPNPLVGWQGQPAWPPQGLQEQGPPGWYGAGIDPYQAAAAQRAGTLAELSAAAYGGVPILTPEAYANLYAQAMGPEAAQADPSPYRDLEPPPVAAPWTPEPQAAPERAAPEPAARPEENPVLQALGIQAF